MKLKLYRKFSTANAMLLTDTAEEGGREWWLPRSQISYCRHTRSTAGGHCPIEITIPDWLAKEKGLLEFEEA